ADWLCRPCRLPPHLPRVLPPLPRRRAAPSRAVTVRCPEGGMTTFLAAEDIVHHLRDYPRGSFTAHQYLLIGVAIFTIVLFTVMDRRTKEVPPKKGIFGLLEFALVWLRDEVVYPCLGPVRGRRSL